VNLKHKILNRGFLGIKGDEFKVTLTSVAYFFFVISSYYVIKPIRGSLGLELGAGFIPYLNILSMISLIAGNAIYSIIVGKYKRDIFIPFITRFFVVCLAIFWIFFSFVFPLETSKKESLKAKAAIVKTEDKPGEVKIASQTVLPVKAASEAVEVKAEQPKAKVARSKEVNWPKVLSPKGIFISCYYLWVNLFALFAVSMFWSFMNDVFTVDQSRRLYAIIGYGGLLGGLCGGILTSYLVKIIGTPNLFILAIILLHPSIMCMKYIHKKYYKPAGVPEEDGTPTEPAHPPKPWDGAKSVWMSPILLFLAFEMFLYTFSSTMFFQQLNQLLEEAFKNDLNQRTEYLAGIYNRINSISLFTQFFVTKLVMLFPKPVMGLLLLNLIQVIGSFFMLSMPGLAVASWVTIIRYALNYSTGRAIRELVYIPLTRQQKYQGKGFIDTVVFRLGDGLSSMLLIGGLSVFSYGKWIDWSILIAMGIQFAVIVKLSGQYSKKILEKKQESN
jgi:ATP/ADP translocase